MWKGEDVERIIELKRYLGRGSRGSNIYKLEKLIMGREEEREIEDSSLGIVYLLNSRILDLLL